VKDLDTLRKEIDQINMDLIELLKIRLEKTLEIAKWKKENKASLYDPDREQREFDHFKEKAVLLGLDPENIVEIMGHIIIYNKKEMQKKMGETDESDYPRS